MQARRALTVMKVHPSSLPCIGSQEHEFGHAMTVPIRFVQTQTYYHRHLMIWLFTIKRRGAQNTHGESYCKEGKHLLPPFKAACCPQAFVSWMLYVPTDVMECLSPVHKHHLYDIFGLYYLKHAQLISFSVWLRIGKS